MPKATPTHTTPSAQDAATRLGASRKSAAPSLVSTADFLAEQKRLAADAAGRAGPSSEPQHFEKSSAADPIGAARNTLVQHVMDAASACLPWSAPASAARHATALRTLAGITPDDDIRDLATGRAFNAAELLAETPAADMRTVRLKLSLLVQRCIGDLDETPMSAQCLKLAAGALADLLVLEDGPIEIPPIARQPIATAEDIARWRRIAAEDHSARAGRAVA